MSVSASVIRARRTAVGDRAAVAVGADRALHDAPGRGRVPRPGRWRQDHWPMPGQPARSPGASPPHRGRPRRRWCAGERGTGWQPPTARLRPGRRRRGALLVPTGTPSAGTAGRVRARIGPVPAFVHAQHVMQAHPSVRQDLPDLVGNGRDQGAGAVSDDDRGGQPLTAQQRGGMAGDDGRVGPVGRAGQVEAEREPDPLASGRPGR